VFRSIVRSLLVTIAVLLAAGAAAEAAEARIAQCLPPASEYSCNVWNGKVTYVGDGDTIYVDVDGDGRRASDRVRLTGINTTELSVYSRSAAERRGECHALEATARLEQLIRGSRRRVRLYALDPSSHSGPRLRRVVAVKIGRRWRDAGRRLITEGHAVWLPNQQEFAWNLDYGRRAERAAEQRLGVWDPVGCGAGPSEGIPLKVTVNGNVRFLNDEWVRVRNLDPVNEVSLGAWSIRDSALNRFVFPDWATLPPGESLTLHVGDGIHTWTEFFWGRRGPVFDNVTRNLRGDAAYLVDPLGNFRAWMTYPCIRNCTDPNQGALEVSAKPRGREYISVENVGAAAVDLDGYQLQSPPYSYPFGRDSVLQPGETVRIWTTGDPAADTRLEKHWGETGPFLNNGGDKVRLSSLRGIVLDCFTWARGRC
jgi:endonuclease YncB( thermonuclease family)